MTVIICAISKSIINFSDNENADTQEIDQPVFNRS